MNHLYLYTYIHIHIHYLLEAGRPIFRILRTDAMGGSNSTDVDDDDEVFVLALPSDLALVLAAGEEEAGGAMVRFDRVPVGCVGVGG